MFQPLPAEIPIPHLTGANFPPDTDQPHKHGPFGPFNAQTAELSGDVLHLRPLEDNIPKKHLQKHITVVMYHRMQRLILEQYLFKIHMQEIQHTAILSFFISAAGSAFHHPCEVTDPAVGTPGKDKTQDQSDEKTNDDKKDIPIGIGQRFIHQAVYGKHPRVVPVRRIRRDAVQKQSRRIQILHRIAAFHQRLQRIQRE